VEKSDEKNRNRWQILQNLAQEKRILDAFALFRENGIEPILIKGSAARFYPSPAQRLSSDIDLAVAAADFEIAKKVLTSEKAALLTVDLHRELRILDQLEWEKLFNNSQLVSIGAEKIRILSDEDNLRVLCVHWLNDGGIHRKRLWDIYWAVKNRTADFDWEKCLSAVSIKRRRWTLAAIETAYRLNGLPIADLPFYEEISQKKTVSDKIIETVLFEWFDKTPLLDLDVAYTDRKRLLVQLRKRLSPNLLQAIIETDSSIGKPFGLIIKTKNFFGRFYLLLKKLPYLVRKKG
jgi:hypothetical protein